MSVIYLTKEKKFIYDIFYKQKLEGLKYYLIKRGIVTEETPECYWIDIFNTSCYKILEIMYEKAPHFDIIILENVFMESNIPTLDKSISFYKYPNGASCTKLLKKVYKNNPDHTFLVAQDDGTKSTVPPMYYALKNVNALSLRKFFHAVYYADNYMSVSNSNFSRAKIRISITNIEMGKFDYVITPGIRGKDNNELLKHCWILSKKAVIIFTKLDKSLPTPYYLVPFNDKMYFYCYDKTVQNCYIAKKHLQTKTSNLELLPCLRQQV